MQVESWKAENCTSVTPLLHCFSHVYRFNTMEKVLGPALVLRAFFLAAASTVDFLLQPHPPFHD